MCQPRISQITFIRLAPIYNTRNTTNTYIKKTQIDPSHIDDVIIGCANQAGEDNRNVARMALLLAGIPYNVPGETINRLCASGMSSVIHAHRAIKANDGDLFISGGVENMTRAPLVSQNLVKHLEEIQKCLIPHLVGDLSILC